MGDRGQDHMREINRAWAGRWEACKRSNICNYVIASCLVILAGSLFVVFFQRLPTEGTSLGLDWRGLWEGIENGVPTYGNQTGLRIPPWSLPLVLPLGLLSFEASWGILTLVTLVVVLLAARRGDGALPFRTAAFAVLSYPTLRTLVDGNFEFLVIGGILLVFAGLNSRIPELCVLGALLAATKVQETWLLLLLLPFVFLGTWPIRELGRSVLLFLAIVGSTLAWKGEEWIAAVFAIRERGSIMDSSLMATTHRLHLPDPASILMWLAVLGVTLLVAWRRRDGLSRNRAAFLMSGSLLLAPYAAANSFLTLLAIGVLPLVSSSAAFGIVLAAAANAPYLLLPFPELRLHWSATYWTLILLLSWLVFGLRETRDQGGRP